MSGFDNPGVFYSDILDDNAAQDDRQVAQRTKWKALFCDFLRKFTRVGTFDFPYRDQLVRHWNLGQHYIEVNLADINDFSDELSTSIRRYPDICIPLIEQAAREVGEKLVDAGQTLHRYPIKGDIQVMITLGDLSTPLRDLKGDFVSKLVKVTGIIVAASSVRAKATNITIQCRNCKNVVNNIGVKSGFQGYALPRKCPTDQAGQPRCPMDPYFIVPDKCQCVDFQILKLQETPEAVPQGEMPRHIQLFCDRFLCERISPGNRVTVVGVYSIKRKSIPSKKGDTSQQNAGTRSSYIRVVSVKVDTQGLGRTEVSSFTAQDEEMFRRIASSPNVYETIARSIAPSIFGSTDIKKSIACLLFSGSRKKMPDGLMRRGDINVLMLGDPGTAKSQLLKFVERCSPIAVYTSGKGSSAAGLTASVIRDPSSRSFVMEGGAMVLADGGVVCIDEFDKMREDDRVAIHEAMEQQTISIAKAGITTTLNSRCAVLAAANSVFGRWDDTKGDQNIDFMPTILSRFDIIFVVRDEHNLARDTTLAKHVIGVHMNTTKEAPVGEEREGIVNGELSLVTLKKYIAYCKAMCGPRLSESAAEKLKHRYVMWRTGHAQSETQAGKRSPVSITVRQLEALIRISEAIAKMRLAPFATESDVEEALRLFHVSTLDAAMSGHLAGAEGMTTVHDQQVMTNIERQLKRRFVIGAQVSEQAIVAEFTRQRFDEALVRRLILAMVRRGELQHRMQRRMLYRIR